MMDRRIPIVIDIETEPDREWIDRTRDSFVEALEPPENYRHADAIARWISDQCARREERAPLSPIDGKITAWAVAPLWQIDVDPVACVNRDDEAELIRLLVSECQLAARGTPLLAGWHINGFDVPMLTARAAVHGLWLPGWWPSMPRRRGATLDAADVLHEGRLATWLQRLDLPSKLGDGKDAPAMPDEQLLEYVRNDVMVERALLRRLAFVSPEIAVTNPSQPQSP